MTYVDSMDWGLPLEKLAFTSVVLSSPSSSMRNMPVTSPCEAVEASNTFGMSNLKVATPEEPSRARVSFTLGTTFSETPLTNWISGSAKSCVAELDRKADAGVEGAKAVAPAIIAEASREEEMGSFILNCCAVTVFGGVVVKYELWLCL